MAHSMKSIQKSTIDKTVSELKKLPQKKKDIFGLRDAIYAMYTDIQSVLGKGYSYDEVAALLSQGGIEIKAITLKQYLADYRRKGVKRSGSKSRQAVGVSASEDLEPLAVHQLEDKANKKKVVSKTEPMSKGLAGGFVEMPDDL
ncbi:MAG TPA: hypothetical protein V6D19_25565 [Stenomitos sp.]